MLNIPEEIKYKIPRIVPINLLQQEYKSAYNKQLPGDLIKAIDDIYIIAGYKNETKKCNEDDNRFNGIVLVKCMLNNILSNYDLAEIAKSVLRTIRTQSFLIFRFNNEEKYSTSNFYINKLNNENNTVLDIVISEHFSDYEQNEKKRRQLERIEKELKNTIGFKDNAKNIYNQLYTILLDNCGHKMEWSNEYNTTELYESDYIENPDYEEEKD